MIFTVTPWVRRILQWTASDGSQGRLLKTARLAYWRLNQPGAERHLVRLGLGPQTFGLPPQTAGRRAAPLSGAGVGGR
jgi:hypothetical protein